MFTKKDFEATAKIIRDRRERFIKQAGITGESTES